MALRKRSLYTDAHELKRFSKALSSYQDIVPCMLEDFGKTLEILLGLSRGDLLHHILQ